MPSSEPIPVRVTPSSGSINEPSSPGSEEPLHANEANVHILSPTSIVPPPIVVSSASDEAPATQSTTAANRPSAIGPGSAILHDVPKHRKAVEGKGFLLREAAVNPVPMFAHLPQWERGSGTASLSARVRDCVPPAVVRLGLAFVKFPLMGAVERCRAMLRVLQTVLREYAPPADQAINRHLEQWLKPLVAYLVQARPLAVSQGNAIRFVKSVIASRIDPECTVERARALLIREIDEYVEKRIDAAIKSVGMLACEKIVDGDVILTYARSTCVLEVIEEAVRQKRRFRVILVDSRPFFEGREKLLPRLCALGVPTTYVHINAIGYVMRDVTKVLVGAFCIFGNGTVMGRTGTAVVCQMGHAHNLPVMVVCETFKFCERVQLDAFVFNELGNPYALLSSSSSADPSEKRAASRASGGRNHVERTFVVPAPTLLSEEDFTAVHANLSLLNILYDVTPSEFVTVVVCEVGLIPVTSIPVVLREYNVASNL